MKPKFNLPISIIERDKDVVFINPGGNIKEIPYSEFGGLWRWKEVQEPSEPSNTIFKYTELGTLRPIWITKSVYNDREKYLKISKKKDFFTKNIILYDINTVKKHSTEGEIKILCFDFEMGSESGGFPNAENDPIIAFGLFMLGDNYLDPLNNDIIIEIDRKNEKKLLEKFIDYIVDLDPDITAGYFSSSFDIPYFLTRCKKLGINVDRLHRLKPEKSMMNNFFEVNGFEVLTGPASSLGYGRVHYDIYKNDVMKDTTLKTKNKRLKTVADAYKLKHIHDLSDDEKGGLLTIKESTLRSYLVSDLRCTGHLANYYITMTLGLANTLEWPLDRTIYRTSGKLADMYGGKMAFLRGFISLRNSAMKFPELVELIKASGGKFEGAYNWACPPIIVEDIQKIDFTSEYPSIMRQFNLSSDTTQLLDIVPIEDNKNVIDYANIGKDFSIGFEDFKDYSIYSIPDNKLKKRIIIKVFKEEGYTTQFIKDFMKQRSEIKKELKKIKDYESFEYKSLDSRQNALKIILNSNYGAYGSPVFENCSYIVGIMVTAMGREFALSLHKQFHDYVLEVDTDGIIVRTKELNHTQFNDYIHKIVREKFKKTEMIMNLEDEYKMDEKIGILISKKKNYALYKDNEVKLVGASFTSSGYPKFFEENTKLLIKEMFQNIDNRSQMLSIFNERKDQFIKQLYQKNEKELVMSYAIKKTKDDFKSAGKPSFRIEQIQEIYLNNHKLMKIQIEKFLEKHIETLPKEIRSDILSRYKSTKSKITNNFFTDYFKFSLYALENIGHHSYNQSIKLMDLYYEKNGSYPMIGESIEWYYRNNTQGIDLFANFRSRSDIDFKSYITKLDTIFGYIEETLPKEEEYSFI